MILIGYNSAFPWIGVDMCGEIWAYESKPVFDGEDYYPSGWEDGLCIGEFEDLPLTDGLLTLTGDIELGGLYFGKEGVLEKWNESEVQDTEAGEL